MQVTPSVSIRPQALKFTYHPDTRKAFDNFKTAMAEAQRNLEKVADQMCKEQELLKWIRKHGLLDGVTSFIKRPDAHNRFITGVLGWQWEDEFELECQKRGMVTAQAPLGHRYDVMVCQSCRVQCKFSNSAKSIDIRNKDKTSNRRYRKDDFDYMAIRAYATNETFIVPIIALLDKDGEYTRQKANLDNLQAYKDRYDLLQGTSHAEF